MTALICVLSPIAIPLSYGVPISLATFAVMLSAALLGSRDGSLAVCLYVVLGMMGLPVFANYGAGIGVVLGMTGGYIIGYIPLAFITGLMYEKGLKTGSRSKEYAMLIAGMLLGAAVLYAVGTVWFIFLTHTSLGYALTACVLPFIPGDLIKMAAAAFLAERLRPILGR